MRQCPDRRTAITRLGRPARAALATFVVLVAATLPGGTPAAAADTDPVDSVNPFIGTADSTAPDPVTGGASGAVFPGATAPFGMVQFSPDTPGADPSGYAYGRSTISGFSLTHFSGAGCRNGEDFPLMPTVGAGATGDSTYRHDSEQASPGYYRVGLGNGVTSELTATTRTAMARFTYPDTADANVVINAGHSATGAASIDVVDDRQVTGRVEAGDFCGTGNKYTVYFSAQFDRPVRTSVQGNRVIATVDASDDHTLQVRVGLSYVSVGGAAANLAAESADRSFDDVHAATRAAWNDRLSKIRVGGGSAAATTTFYTALYHSMVAPNTFSDANGDYLGYDSARHHADGYTQYSNFSGWDVYRSQVQLLAVAAPDVATDLARSLIADGQQCGVMPRWGHANTETSDMVGDPATATVSSVDAFGASGFDRQGAYGLMVKSATNPGATCQGRLIRPGLADYLSKGYLDTTPYPGAAPGDGPAAVTQEYAIADFALSQYASRLGAGDDAAKFGARAENWRNVFDGAYPHPRGQDGEFTSPFEVTSDRGFVEGNAAQYTFMVPQNLRGLADAMGGTDTAVRRLDDLFTELNAGLSKPYFYLGNEPQFGNPWAYDWYGAPARTQDVVRRIRRDLFTAEPGGLPGNDDLGATSSLLVWAAIGLYPEVTGTDVLALNSPLFPQVTITRPNGATIDISAPQASDDTPYVAGLSVNGQSSNRPWIRFTEVRDGGSLNFAMSNTATDWGSALQDAPPSWGNGN